MEEKGGNNNTNKIEEIAQSPEIDVWNRLNETKNDENIINYIKEQEAEQELLECTFQPQISKISTVITYNMADKQLYNKTCSRKVIQ